MQNEEGSPVFHSAFIILHSTPMPDTRWLHFALLAAGCAASINIFGKIGMRGIDPDVATAVRSVVQAAFVVGFVGVIGSWSKIDQLAGRPMAVGMVVCSGVAGGLSWIFAFRALRLADASQVAPIDKLSMPLGVLLAVLLLHERPTVTNWVGILMIAAGAYLAARPRPATVLVRSPAPIELPFSDGADGRAPAVPPTRPSGPSLNRE
jgi:transporter family protein